MGRPSLGDAPAARSPLCPPTLMCARSRGRRRPDATAGARMPLSLEVIAAALASGALVGALLALFGGGGSVLATPLLLYVVGVRDPHVAIGTSAAAVAVNALVALARHARVGQVKWPCALVYGGAGL